MARKAERELERPGAIEQAKGTDHRLCAVLDEAPRRDHPDHVGGFRARGEARHSPRHEESQRQGRKRCALRSTCRNSSLHLFMSEGYVAADCRRSCTISGGAPAVPLRGSISHCPPSWPHMEGRETPRARSRISALGFGSQSDRYSRPHCANSSHTSHYPVGVSAMPTASNAASTARILSARSFSGSNRNSERAASTRPRRLSRNSDCRLKCADKAM